MLQCNWPKLVGCLIKDEIGTEYCNYCMFSLLLWPMAKSTTRVSFQSWACNRNRKNLMALKVASGIPDELVSVCSKNIAHPNKILINCKLHRYDYMYILFRLFTATDAIYSRSTKKPCLYSIFEYMCNFRGFLVYMWLKKVWGIKLIQWYV